MLTMISSSELKKRVERLHLSMECEGIESLLVSNPKNVGYLTGKETGRILLSKDQDTLWTRELYTEMHSDLYFGKGYPFEVAVYEKDAVKRKIADLGIENIAVENMPFLKYENTCKELGMKVLVSEIVEWQRAVKTVEEMEMLGKSARIAVNAMEKAYDVVREGVREIDALAEIEYEIRMRGSDSPPFNDGMLLSSGKDSADIHARAGRRKIKSPSTVVVDLGGRYSGYYSDMTRTLEVGRIDAKEKDLLLFVDDLRARAIDMIREGMKAGDLHSFVEKEMEKKGYKFFHGSGHGVGLEVHEFPSIARDSADVLKDGMVFTIEPGIYIPGKMGVRFEDMVLLKNGKARILTR